MTPAQKSSISLPAAKVEAVQQAVLAWYRRGHRDLPWRQTRDPYAVLVSEIMLQQTQVDRVIPKYQQWLARYPSLAALAAAPRAEVIRNWAPLGYNLRAVRLHVIARQVVDRCGGKLPDTVEGLLSLKGIGPYTAGAVACFAFGRQTAALDTNVRRVLGRIFAAEAPDALDDDRAAWRIAEAALPRPVGPSPTTPHLNPLPEGEGSDGSPSGKVDSPSPLRWGKGPGDKGHPASLSRVEGSDAYGDVYDWNQALMDLGATICVSRVPRCLLCPAQARCSARGAWPAEPPAVDGRAPSGSARVAVDVWVPWGSAQAAVDKQAPWAIDEAADGQAPWERRAVEQAAAGASGAQGGAAYAPRDAGRHAAERRGAYETGRDRNVSESSPAGEASAAGHAALASTVSWQTADDGPLRGTGATPARRSRRAATERFEGSRRWYRGRMVDALRALPPGAALDLAGLGRQLKPDFAPADLPWLLDVARALARDGLVDLVEDREGGGSVTLPG